MNDATYARLFDARQAFGHPVTLWITLCVAGILIFAAVLIFALRAAGKTSDKLHGELVQRYLSWLVLVPLLLLPVLLGSAWTILAVAVLSTLCYHEFARNTPLKQERAINTVAYLGIAALTFAVADHWYNFYVALFPLVTGLIAIVAILADRPQGYIQRVALGVLAFSLFGCALSHLGYMANDKDYRPLVLMIFLCVELNDVFAFLCGKTFGRRKLMPHTSPNKTIGGSLGAVVLTTALAASLGHYVFRGTPLDTVAHLLMLGVIISIVGQLGDLMLSSVKRDLGIKDMGTLLPGHGGLLDRFDSLILVAPAVFHYVGYYLGFGLDQQTRIMSGRW